jgi:hypothetical protein
MQLPQIEPQNGSLMPFRGPRLRFAFHSSATRAPRHFGGLRLPRITNLLDSQSGVFSFLFAAFTIWMLIECVRSDPERYLWLWIILCIPGIGPFVYLFVRWLPNRHLRPPGWLRGLTRGREIRRLESAAIRIGNAYHHVQFGDALWETGQCQRARAAYSRALEKEPDNLAALWGQGQVDVHFKAYDDARVCFEKLLKHDPQYKFGDASLAYAKTLVSLQRNDEASAYLEKHIKRWPQPEGICLLAQLDAQAGQYETARSRLEAMMADLDVSPAAIARKQGKWRRRGRQLLRKLASRT